MPYLQALTGALVHAHGHVDDVAPVVARHQLRAADGAPLDELAELAVAVTADAADHLCADRLERIAPCAVCHSVSTINPHPMP